MSNIAIALRSIRRPSQMLRRRVPRGRTPGLPRAALICVKLCDGEFRPFQARLSDVRFWLHHRRFPKIFRSLTNQRRTKQYLQTPALCSQAWVSRTHPTRKSVDADAIMRTSSGLLTTSWGTDMGDSHSDALQRRAIEPEEAFLERRFGANYIRYKDNVRRWI
jgi:hypothetical protein